jgi:hypothetical protein
MKTITIIATDQNGTLLDKTEINVPNDYGTIHVQALKNDDQLPTWNNPDQENLQIGTQ